MIPGRKEPTIDERKRQIMRSSAGITERRYGSANAPRKIGTVRTITLPTLNLPRGTDAES